MLLLTMVQLRLLLLLLSCSTVPVEDGSFNLVYASHAKMELVNRKQENEKKNARIVNKM